MSLLDYIKLSMRNIIAALILLVVSLPTFSTSLAQLPGNALRDSKGVWSTDKDGKWMFCAFVTDEAGGLISAAKCWRVPGSVTDTRDAYFKN